MDSTWLTAERLGVACLGIAALAATLGVVSWVRRARRRPRMVVLEGEVVEFRAGEGEADAGCFAPVVRYTRPDGSVHELPGRELDNPSPFTMQQRVPVLFDPERPDDAWLAYDFDAAAPYAHFVVAAVMAGVSLVFFFVLGAR